MLNLNKSLIPAVVMVLGTLGLLSAGSADAATTSLPITSYYQMVVDAAHSHIFISEGSSSVNHILVTDLSGQQVTTITGQNGVMGLALSPDGSTLYAALSASHAVTAIDTSTLQQTASYPIGNTNTPQDVAVQSGKVWVSYATSTPAAATIGDIDLTANTPAFQTQANMGSWYYPPELAADPQDTGVLVAADPGLSPASVATYNTTVDPATVRASSNFFQNCDNQQDLAVVPGGSEFILACGAPYAHYRYLTADLSQQGSYGSSYYPNAVAIDSAGDVAAGVNAHVPDLWIYQQNGDTALNTYSLDTSGYNIAARGLVWAPDGSELFAVLTGNSSTYALQVIAAPTVPATTLTLNGPSTVTIGQQVALTGSLVMSAGGSPVPAGTTVDISRSLAGTAGTTDFQVTTAADGSFSLTDTPPSTGQYTYAASYAGSKTAGPSTASHAVTVSLAGITLSLNGPSTATIGQQVALTGSLTLSAGGTLPTGTAVTVTRSVAGGPGTQVFNLQTAADGSFSLTDTPPAAGKYTYAASYAGDATTAPATTSHIVTVSLLTPSLTLSTGPATYTYEPTVKVTAHLGTTDTNRTVSIYAQPFGSTTRKLLKTGRVNSSGNLTVSYLAPHSTTFSAVFTGDAKYAPKTVTRVIHVRAKVTETLSGYYSSTTIGGNTYRLFHHTSPLHVSVKVSPNKSGQCVKVEIQQYYQGAWHPNVVTGCGKLSSSSQIAGAFNLTHAGIDTRYRMRADYVRSASDTSNLSNDSTWQYFIVKT